MTELRLTDNDRAILRELRISLDADLRTPEQAEARLLIPEWIRRTQWRHFWEDQDSVYAVSQQTHDTACEITAPQGKLALTGDVFRFPSRDTPHPRSEFVNGNAFIASRNKGIRVPDVATVLMLLVLAVGVLLCIYLHN